MTIATKRARCIALSLLPLKLFDKLLDKLLNKRASRGKTAAEASVHNSRPADEAQRACSAEAVQAPNQRVVDRKSQVVAQVEGTSIIGILRRNTVCFTLAQVSHNFLSMQGV